MKEAFTPIAYWHERIARDLGPFCDPGTELRLDKNGRIVEAYWQSRSTERHATFRISLEGGVTVSCDGNNVEYRSFLVGPTMADLPSLAKMILQSRKAGIYVDTKAVVENVANPTEGSALSELQNLLDTEDPNATKVVIVTGEAGAGKTRVLEELVRTQALAFIKGQTTRLFLYVNAQGRALARFNEALATELDDLRSQLPYHTVATLTRLGALVPIIDGFDELLGVSGYDDAFSSLAGFIEELDGQGQIVASARSTYYEEEFVARASSVSSLGGQYWVQVPMTIKAWGDSELQQFVKLRSEEVNWEGSTVDDLQKKLKEIFAGASAQLREKPLFVVRTLELLLDGKDIAPGEDLLKRLVDAFVDRERKDKLLDQNQRPLLTADQIVHLLSELAEEMWNQETRELDRRSVREVAEYVMVVDGLPERTQRIVVERMPTMAFFSPGENQGDIRFEHEVFLSFFLGRVLGSKLRQDESVVRVFLSRSALPPEVGTAAVESVVGPEGSSLDLRDTVSKLSSIAGFTGIKQAQVRENTGRLVEAMLKNWAHRMHTPITGLSIQDVVFPGGNLFGVHLSECKLSRVTFIRTDLSRTQMEKCEATDCLLQEITVDPSKTKLNLKGFDHTTQLIGLRVLDQSHGSSTIQTLFDPGAFQTVLISIGLLDSPREDPDVRTIPPQPGKLINRVMMAYSRSNPICTSDDNYQLRSVFSSPDWPKLERLLVNNGIVTRESRQANGPKKDFLRRQYLPEQILAGLHRRANVPQAIRNFWDAAEQEWH